MPVDRPLGRVCRYVCMYVCVCMSIDNPPHAQGGEEEEAPGAEAVRAGEEEEEEAKLGHGHDANPDERLPVPVVWCGGSA